MAAWMSVCVTPAQEKKCCQSSGSNSERGNVRLHLCERLGLGDLLVCLLGEILLRFERCVGHGGQMAGGDGEGGVLIEI